jgi:hypothetical protein
MHPEPEYLRHLGDMTTLKDFLGSWYHQDAWDEYRVDEERWQAFRKSSSPEELVRVREQVERLAARNTDEVHHFIQTNADALHFEEPQSSRDWLEDFKSWLRETDENAAGV